MQDSITHEALEALSKKATQGVWDIAAYYTGTGPDENCHGLVEVEDFPIGIIDEEGATAESLSPNLEFIVALVNLYRTGQLILAQPSGDEVEAVADAIERAECPGREGPFGGYDYGQNEAFYGKAPDGGRYVIRDFRDPASPDWGKWLHQTENRDEHDAMFEKMTREHIATAAITALDAVRGKQACRKARENSDG